MKIEKSYKDKAIHTPEKSQHQSAGIDDPDVLPVDYQENIRYKEDTRHRKLLIYWMVGTVSIWLISVLVIISLNAGLFHIETRVICVLLATTTINVLGLSKIILNGLFNKK